MSNKEYEPLPSSEPNAIEDEERSLLPKLGFGSRPLTSVSFFNTCRSKLSALGPISTLAIGYFLGVITVLILRSCLPRSYTTYSGIPQFAQGGVYVNSAQPASFPGAIGSTQTHAWPPPSPTNVVPSLFPTEIGYAGPVATGAEAGLVLTAGEGNYPSWKGVEGLVKPELWEHRHAEETPEWIEEDSSTDGKRHNEKFSIFKNWGNLTPFHSVPADSFGITSDTGPEVPNGCTLKGVHIMHRHGARYPTGSGHGSPARLASKLHSAASTAQGIKAHSQLSFLNTWTYKLGTDYLTPFGRQEMFDLGVSMRVKYGSLLEGFTDRLPVFRTESEDRMLASATNFAFGFFGWPLEDKFLLSVTIEEKKFNNTLVPDKVCPNDWNPLIGNRGAYYIKQWVSIYLVHARRRIQSWLEGYELSMEDVYAMQMMCAYETVSLGYSKFCTLFTQDEWEGFEYSLDLQFWYNYGFGSPVARALGSGYILELLARLTSTPLARHPTPPLTSTFSVNHTLAGNPITFPVDQPLYVDATHDTVIVNILTALNLTSISGLEEDGPPSWKRMKRGRKWRVSRLAPFASNMQMQLLECPAVDSDTQIRIILNDAVVSLTGIKGCPEQKDGLCPVDKFVKAQKTMLEGVNWDWTCHGNWTLPEGDAWSTVTGDPPSK